MAELLPCVEVGPDDHADGAIVWLHGLGASGHDFEDIVPMLRLPGMRFVFPHAPRRSVTINGGMIMPAWYDILRFSDAAGSERADQVRESAAMVEALLERERDRGVPSDRTVLAGFSQGGAMALYTGVRHAHPLAGIMVLSGYEVLSSERQVAPENAATPMLFGHGTHDPVVPADRGRAAMRAYESGRAAEWHEYAMAHEVCIEEIAHVRDWLHARLDPAG